MLAYYDKSFASGLRDSDLSCATLLPMIQFDCGANGRFPNEVVYKKAQDLRNVEEKLRNPAAHNITAIKEEYFTRVAGISSDRVLKDLQWMFRYTYPNYFPAGVDVWDSYNKMNKHIWQVKRLKNIYKLSIGDNRISKLSGSLKMSFKGIDNPAKPDVSHCLPPFRL